MMRLATSGKACAQTAAPQAGLCRRSRKGFHTTFKSKASKALLDLNSSRRNSQADAKQPQMAVPHAGPGVDYCSSANA